MGTMQEKEVQLNLSLSKSMVTMHEKGNERPEEEKDGSSVDNEYLESVLNSRNRAADW